MQPILRHVLAAAALAFSGTALRSQVYYVETAPLTFLAGFTTTGISGTTIGPKPVPVGVIDPDALRPVDRVTTDIGTLISYSVGNGDQAFFTKQLIRAAAERYAESYRELAQQLANSIGSVEEKAAATRGLIKDTQSDLDLALALYATNAAKVDALDTLIAGTEDPDKIADLTAQRNALANAQPGIASAIEDYKALLAAYETRLAQYLAEIASENAEYTPRLNALEARIDYLNRHKDGPWELTALRAPQASVEGVITTPYQIFLTRIERTRGSGHSFDTGLRLTPIVSAANTTEVRNGDRVVRASGTVTAHFRLEFENFYATNPLSAVKAEARAKAVEGETYNSAGEFWMLGGSGYMTYSIRSTPGPLAAISASKIRITGHASWSHLIWDSEGLGGAFGGVAPFAIKMGDAKYQNRGLFPDFQPDNT